MRRRWTKEGGGEEKEKEEEEETGGCWKFIFPVLESCVAFLRFSDISCSGH